MQEGTLEVHHSILSAILCLAGKPLQPNYQPSAAALARLQDVSPGVHGLLCTLLLCRLPTCGVASMLAIKTKHTCHVTIPT